MATSLANLLVRAGVSLPAGVHRVQEETPGHPPWQLPTQPSFPVPSGVGVPEHTSSLFWLEQQHIICGKVLLTCKGLNPGPQPSGAVTSSCLSPSTQSLLSFLALPGGSSGKNPVFHLFLQTRVNSSRTDLSGYLDTLQDLQVSLVPAGLASALENSALAWLPGVQAHRSSPGEAVKEKQFSLRMRARQRINQRSKGPGTVCFPLGHAHLSGAAFPPARGRGHRARGSRSHRGGGRGGR